MHPHIATICTPLSAFETRLAAILSALSAHLQALALHLHSAPITAAATSSLSSLHVAAHAALSSIPPLWQSVLSIPLYFLLAVAIVALLSLSARLYYGSDPVLLAFPAPASDYDPYADEQSHLFLDADVRPLLVPAAQAHPATTLLAVDPRTAHPLGRVPSVPDTPAVHDLVARARTVQPAWAAVSFAHRRRVLRVLKTFILYEQRLLCELSCRDSGKTMLEASLGEIVPTLEKLRWLLAEGESALLPDPRSTGPMTRHKRACVEYMPLGVIAAIAPWNYPLHNFINPVVAALFAGNAIVVKPSEHTVYSSVYYARMVRRALSLCGHSADLVQVVVGEADAGAALVDADVDKLFFTGSTAVGKKVAVAAARRLLPVVLELGGKDAFVVCDDADLPHAAALCLRGVFQNAGQNCIGVERVLVHAKVLSQFVDCVLPCVKAMRLGIDMGAMTLGEAAIEGVQSMVDEAVQMGAKVLVGGKRANLDGKGYYYEPTVLNGVTPDMRIAKEEVFGPVLSIMEWSSDTQLIRMVNGCSLGLGSSVFTADQRRADRIVAALRVGMGNVNDFATNYLCQSMPFGGTKESGYDKFAGIEGLRGCCVAKAVTRDRFRWIKTTIPRPLRYPTAPNAFEFASDINDLMFGARIGSKVDNLRNILGMLLFPTWKPRTVGGG